MDDDIVRYLNNQINVFKGEFIVTREKSPNGYERITFKIADGKFNDSVFSVQWRKIGEKIELESPPPKHTGGKKPYLMLMVDEIESLRAQGVKNIEELIGYVVSLGKYIEWNTGKLIHKRSKKPLQYKDLMEIYQCSNKKLNKMINLMKKHDLLYHTDEGYFISSKYIKKGKSNKGKSKQI